MSGMKTVNDIDIEDIHNVFDSVIFLRGEEYFEEGLVTSIEPINSRTITGTVRGNRTYNVSISIDENGDIICDCSCPCDFNCKHAAAVLLKWLSVKKNYEEKLKQVKPFVRETLSQILAKKSKTELINLIETFIEKHPELKIFVIIEHKEIISKIKRLFSQFWEWDEIQDLIDHLETILEGIRLNKQQIGNKTLFDEMSVCSKIMIENVENIHGEEDLGIFFEEWFQTYGEIFSATKPTINEKKEFVQTIVKWMEKDDYGYDSSYERALFGMCTSEEDIEVIKKGLKTIEMRYPENREYYQRFCLELYDKIGMDEKYIEIAKQSGFTSILVDKLITLDRLDEALNICNRNIQKNFSIHLENKKIEILKKLGRKSEGAQSIFNLLEKTGDFNYYLKLKQEVPKEEWNNYFNRVISDAKSKKRFALLSRIYYTEKNYKKAYAYIQDIDDLNYLELLAKKLTTVNPKLSCELFRRLCFNWINQGAGWPYKKAGKMLEAIKRIDKNGDFFKKTKQEITQKYKKKWSLMEIIERI